MCAEHGAYLGGESPLWGLQLRFLTLVMLGFHNESLHNIQSSL